MTFTIHRGTNISHWLSQSKRRGAERATFFKEDDVRTIARLGFDHIRLPIDEEQMWDEQGRKDPEAFSLLDAALDWCEQHNLRVVVDLHILRSHYFNDRQAPALFTDPAETQRFNGLWVDLSSHMRQRSTDMVAYELLNEAVAQDPDDWNRVAMCAFQTVRRREPERTIVLGSNRWNSALTYDELQIPEDPHTILTFHYYHPMLFTHWTAHWWDGGAYSGPIHYPGKPVAEDDLRDLQGDLRAIVEHNNQEAWNRERILRDFAQPLTAKARTGYTLYCGEFGVYQPVPLPLRLAWYRDVLSLFNEHNITWANWDYKGGFGPVVKDGQPTEIVDVLLG